MHDDEPTFTSAGERQVYAALQAQLPEGARVLSNFRLTGKYDHEIDFVVLLPGAGIGVLEVKGGSVWVDDDGAWRQGKDAHEIRPVKQARDGKFALRDYIEADPRWSRARPPYAHMVVLPHTQLHPDFAVPRCSRAEVTDRYDLEHLVERLGRLLTPMGKQVPLDEDSIDLIEQVLVGRHLPTRDIRAQADETEADTLHRLTQEQALLLSVTRLLPRVEIRGCAGSGKTMLALAQSTSLTRGANDTKPQRVALVCYSLGLAAFLRREIAPVTRKHQPAFVGSFEDLARRWGITEFGDRTNSRFWEEDLPRLMAERAPDLPDGEKFDAFIVDEAQDFADSWWEPILAGLRDPERGGLYIYADENQRIFKRFGRPPVSLVPLVLDHNLRNTKQIVKAFEPLAPMRMRAQGGDGPEVTVVTCSGRDVLDTGDDQVDALLDAGWDPRDVALLTTGSSHPVQKERVQAHGHAGYWQTFWDEDDVFYGHVLGFKGLERRAVVLCVNSQTGADRGAEMLYVGLSRATHQLVVVGDPDVIRSMGGARVARRLGLDKP